MAKRGLYANIHAKRKRIKAGSKEKMRKVGSKGAPTAKAFKQAAKTAKKPKKRGPRRWWDIITVRKPKRKLKRKLRKLKNDW